MTTSLKTRNRRVHAFTADEAFALLGVDRTTGYRSIKDGTFPVPVIKVGRLIRVPVAPLQALLFLRNAAVEAERSDGVDNARYAVDQTFDAAVVPAGRAHRSSQTRVEDPTVTSVEIGHGAL
jgi:predicted DNA-binding transcriptional regulator AlpA